MSTKREDDLELENQATAWLSTLLTDFYTRYEDAFDLWNVNFWMEDGKLTLGIYDDQDDETTEYIISVQRVDRA